MDKNLFLGRKDKMELVRILKNKKTGKYHCPKCLKKCKVREIKDSKEKVLDCKKCKMFYAYPREEDCS